MKPRRKVSYQIKTNRCPRRIGVIPSKAKRKKTFVENQSLPESMDGSPNSQYSRITVPILPRIVRSSDILLSHDFTIYVCNVGTLLSQPYPEVSNPVTGKKNVCAHRNGHPSNY